MAEQTKRLRLAVDVIVGQNEYLDKADWLYLNQQIETVLKEVVFPTQGISPELVEVTTRHIHISSPDSNCAFEYGMAEDNLN